MSRPGGVRWFTLKVHKDNYPCIYKKPREIFKNITNMPDLFPLCSPWVFFTLFMHCMHFLFLPSIQAETYWFGGIAWFSLEFCSIYAFAFIARNHRWCWCVRSSLKSSVLPFNPTHSDSRTKALQKNTLKRNQNMYLYHFFDCHSAHIKRTRLSAWFMSPMWEF